MKKYVHFIIFALIFISLRSHSIFASNPNPEVPPVMTVNSSCVKQVTPNVKITYWFFGFIDEDPRSGKFTYRSANNVPLTMGQNFGYRIELELTNQKQVKWNDSYTLPAPIKGWQKILDNPAIKVSPDEMTAYSEGILPGPKPVIEQVWYIIPEDTTGKSNFTVYIDGRKACVFDFDVRVPKK